MSFSLFKLQLLLILQLTKGSLSLLLTSLKNPLFLTTLITTFLIVNTTVYFLFQQQISQNIQTYYQTQLTKNKELVQNQIIFWESVSHPNRQIYLELARLYLYLGDEQKAQQFRALAMSVDPNFEIQTNQP